MNILCLILFISSSDLCKCILELIHSKLEFIFDKNTCHCTFRYYLNLQTHCSICKVLYVKLFIKTIPHILKFQLAFLRPYILMWRRLKECAKLSLEIFIAFWHFPTWQMCQRSTDIRYVLCIYLLRINCIRALTGKWKALVEEIGVLA